MIISRTPLRVSFVGGGTDLPAYYREAAGAVVSTAVDKSVYITVNRKFDSRIRVSYSKTEEVATVAELDHPLVREALKLLKLDGGVEITSIADIPSRGTGLGSSSAFTVGLLHALHAYMGQYRTAEQLAEEGCELEIARCGEPIGKQDQYASAFGGFNFIRFHADESVSVEPILCRRETFRDLEAGLLFFYTGMTRSASTILKEKQRAIAVSKAKRETLKRMVGFAHQLKADLSNNNLDTFGEILHENWLLKKSLARRVSNERIDHWYALARKHGATGGKLLGAGAGGFLMFYAPPERHARIVKALAKLPRVPVRFASQGSRIVFVHY